MPFCPSNWLRAPFGFIFLQSGLPSGQSPNLPERWLEAPIDDDESLAAIENGRTNGVTPLVSDAWKCNIQSESVHSNSIRRIRTEAPGEFTYSRALGCKVCSANATDANEREIQWSEFKLRIIQAKRPV